MKKHELIKYAYDNYPKGTRFKQMKSGNEIISTGIFDICRFGENCIYDIGNGNSVYCPPLDKWATIITNDKQLVLVSEDGVSLYVGDNFFWARKHNGEWALSDHRDDDDKYVFTFEQDSYLRAMVVSSPDENKAFSTKQAAEKWIEEQNKPKEIILFKDSSSPAIVKKESVYFDGVNGSKIFITTGELEEIYKAYKSLQ